MSSPTTTVAAPVAVISRREMLSARLAAYFELSKPRIAALVLVVVAVSALVGGWGRRSRGPCCTRCWGPHWWRPAPARSIRLSSAAAMP